MDKFVERKACADAGPIARPAESWASGAAYEPYIGRWSRLIADEFLQWLPVRRGVRWLEVGCGTGALTTTVVYVAAPAMMVATDRSSAYLSYARAHAPTGPLHFVVADAMRLPVRPGVVDAVVSGLVLNFLPDPVAGVTGMLELTRVGGVVAAYVWDYSGGVELLRAFWDVAVELDPGATTLDEGARFPLCDPHRLEQLWREVGLLDVHSSGIEVATCFEDFEDYWRPFLGGQGPAPAYVASLDGQRQAALRDRLRAHLGTGPSGRIELRARAWAVRGRRAA